VLGTDGFGRSDYRVKLRRFFEVDRYYVVVAALKALADDGAIKHRSSPRRSRSTGWTPSARRRGPFDAENNNMSQAIDIKVPDIGDFADIPVIEVFVKVGDTVKAEDPLLSLESDKATMDVPSPRGGVVKAIAVKVGDKVSEGSVLMQFAGEAAAAAPAEAVKPSVSAPPSPVSAPAGLAEVRVPDIGDFSDVPVIEVFVKVGDTVKAEDPLVSLESDKATMDVPAPLSGVVREVKVAIGDKVSEGSVILTLTTGEATAAPPAAAAVAAAGAAPPAAGGPASAPASAPGAGVDEAAFALAYAGPAVRKLARELGVDLGKVKGTGDHGRIVRADVEAFAQGGAAAAAPKGRGPAAAPSGATGSGGLDLLPWPKVDFAKFGPIERKELSRIKKISAANLHRNWVVIPHVTTHDEADITDLEQFRVQMNKELEKSGVKISMLPFMMKAAVATLKSSRVQRQPRRRQPGAEELLAHRLRGRHAERAGGAGDPRRRQEDDSGDHEGDGRARQARARRQAEARPDAGRHLHDLVARRDRRHLLHADHQRPEVAIMGVCKSYWKQHSSDGKTSSWRLTLPLSLSWDHRVIDGAAAARFNVHFANLLADMRRVLF
jgi:pyruvate dehydrogenase E2 component (dihydrolipoamide acetyltransferase)